MTKRDASLTAKADSSVSTSSQPVPSRQLNVGRELADTTWRIAVPVILFAGIGLVIDRTSGTKPWLTLLGMAVGLVIAGYLIQRQLKRWPATLPKPGSYERNRRQGDDEHKSYYDD